MTFVKNVFIKGKIHLKTGLHIGGLKEGVEIGGCDNPVIYGWTRHNNELRKVPIIPGSSLKGKIRSLLEVKYGAYRTYEDKGEHLNLEELKNRVKDILDRYLNNKFTSINDEKERKRKINDEITDITELIITLSDNKDKLKETLTKNKNIDLSTLDTLLKKTLHAGKILKIFGKGADPSVKTFPTRLVVRDCSPTKETIEEWEQNDELVNGTELKVENTINRITSAATPRQIERIPAGSKFEFEFILSVYEGDKEEEMLKTLFEGMHLLEDNYLGGSGSRGYGKIEFQIESIKEKTKNDYIQGNEAKDYEKLKDVRSVTEALKKLNEQKC
mgnify:CR=1 FL=1